MAGATSAESGFRAALGRRLRTWLGIEQRLARLEEGHAQLARDAQAHLSGLQAGFDRLEAAQREAAQGLEGLGQGLGDLERAVADLERGQTAISRALDTGRDDTGSG